MFSYIGITDFTAAWQVKKMLEVLKKGQQQGSTRRLHVGVMMSYKTFRGIPTRWQNSFPPKASIPGIFVSNEVYNCLHYADYDQASRQDDWRNPELPRMLSLAIECCGIGIHAIQLDMIWPDPGQVADGVHRSRRNPEIILQIGRKALDGVNNDPGLLVQKLADYEGVIHRVLLDKSGGEGRILDASALRVFACAVRDAYPDLGLVFAGGLGPDTLHLVEPLVHEFPDASIDAQGRLRPSGNALDPIDWDMAGEYLTRALRLFR